ncbi:MAG: MBOAT family protein [Anaerolineales bacterium]|nr:MBOAT family protein [Anaerolineales bacterium]
MEIISLSFLIFAVIVLAVYYLLSQRAQNFWLLLVSYVFYLSFGWQYGMVLAGATLVNYWLAIQIGKGKKAWLVPGILVNAGSFGIMKLIAGPYGPGLLGHFLLNWDGALSTRILLPIGFSFYILQAISYLIDVSRRQITPTENLVDFALYLAYFPKLLAGPIERARDFLPQIEKGRIVNNTAAGRNIGLIVIGLLRKVIIADHLNYLRPIDIFTHPLEYSILERLIWLLVFAFGLYNDFAGYTSIVRGLSGLMGIELASNFSQPFFAHSFSDFWNRWHTSLSHWLRDYTFYPTRRWLLKHRAPDLVTMAFPPLITMLVSGYWHGAYITMLLWGCLHGFYLILDQLLKLEGRTAPTAGFSLRNSLTWLLVFILVTATWVPFSASSTLTALDFFRGPISAHLNFPAITLIDLSLLVIFSLWTDWQEYRNEPDAFFLGWKQATKIWALAGALLLLLLLAGKMSNLSGFVYQGF